jgi:hypothetical protein
MNWGVYGLLVVFGAFIVLMIVNPKLSCFGRRIRSPLYPLTKKGRLRRKGYPGQRTSTPPVPGGTPGASKKTDDYGFRLD